MKNRSPPNIINTVETSIREKKISVENDVIST
jgi:hypothetical protein